MLLEQQPLQNRPEAAQVLHERGRQVGTFVLIEQRLQLTGISIGPRPLPYSNARAMRLSEIQPGGETSGLNSFATLNGHGMYDVALGIRPRIGTRYVAHSLGNVAPNGLKDSLQTLPPFGGPWPAVGTALTSSPSGTRLYIRGGNYPVNQLFTTPMTIRRYDFYEADGTVTIQR